MNEKREISGGAEKVEEIARRRAGILPEEGAAPQERAAMQAAAADGGARAAKKQGAPALSAEQAERARAEQRVERARQKRAKARKKEERQAERAAQKSARAKQKRRAAAEKRHAEAERRAAAQARAAGREKDGGKQKHARAPGFGGWLAAVVSLSVAVLALGSLVTVGYFELSGAKESLAAGYRASAYAFSEAVEELDADLTKARIAEGGELSRLLAQIYAESLLAENCVQAFPADARQTAGLSACINRTGEFAKGALSVLSEGGTLSAAQTERLAALEEQIALVRESVPALIAEASAGSADGLAAQGGGYCAALEDLSARLAQMCPQAHAARQALAGEEEVSEQRARELLEEYLREAELVSVRCLGREEGRLPCYCFAADAASGRQYYAQLSVRGGKLSLLESYVPCTQRNYDAAACVQIARNFLERCGFADMEEVWTSEAGGECTVEFAPVQGGTLLYPDRVKVKVCSERGEVSGVSAGGYLLHHRARSLGGARVSAARVRANAEAKLENVSVRSALIPHAGGELLCWQVRGEADGTLYFAYVDAQTGHTAEIRAVRRTDRGDLPL